MNLEKAREYFSAYYESTLDAGLKQAFETRLRTDETLQADYAAFVETMMELEALPEEDIEIPLFLADRIATRLEQEELRRRKATPGWVMWLRGFAFAGLSAAAILGAVISMNRSGRASAAGITGAADDGNQISFSVNGPEVALRYHPSQPRTVIISSGMTGREISHYVADASTPAQTLRNPQPGTALFQIQIVNDPASDVLLAIPGKGGVMKGPGSGSVKEFLAALAGYYHLPAVFRGTDAGRRVAWKLVDSLPNHAGDSVNADTRLVIDQRENGMFVVMDR